jgi:hypothetical protein
MHKALAPHKSRSKAEVVALVVINQYKIRWETDASTSESMNPNLTGWRVDASRWFSKTFNVFDDIMQKF